MIHGIDSLYELDKRSKHLQKYKEFEDEFVITGFDEGTGIHKGTVTYGNVKQKMVNYFKNTFRGYFTV